MSTKANFTTNEPKKLSAIPNSYQTPNVLVDKLMPLLTPVEWVVLSFAVRHILGWRDKIVARKATISLTQFEKTGLARQTILDALEQLSKYGLLRKSGKPSPKGQVWSLAFDQRVDLTGLQKRNEQKQAKAHRQTSHATQKSQEKRKSVAGTSNVPVAGTSNVHNKTHSLNTGYPSLQSDPKMSLSSVNVDPSLGSDVALPGANSMHQPLPDTHATPHDDTGSFASHPSKQSSSELLDRAGARGAGEIKHNPAIYEWVRRRVTHGGGTHKHLNFMSDAVSRNVTLPAGYEDYWLDGVMGWCREYHPHQLGLPNNDETWEAVIVEWIGGGFPGRDDPTLRFRHDPDCTDCDGSGRIEQQYDGDQIIPSHYCNGWVDRQETAR